MRRARHWVASACLVALAVALCGQESHFVATARGNKLGDEMFKIMTKDMPTGPSALEKWLEKQDDERRLHNAIVGGVCAGIAGLSLYIIIRNAVKSALPKPPRRFATRPSPPEAKGPSALIEELVFMRDIGALTEEEFEQKKAEILSRM